jgi:cellulose synthase (UDP-forming)
MRTSLRRFHLATFIMLGVIAISAAVAGAWFMGEGRISAIFAQVHSLQQSPPLWIQVPLVTREYLLAPTVILFLAAFAVTKASPLPRRWSRAVVAGILLALTVRYVLWRLLSTLNLADPLNGTLSIVLFVGEMVMLTSTTIQVLLLLNIRDRTPQADRLSQAVRVGLYNPSVDIFVPTFDEPSFILRRTVIGCQAIDYPHKRVYLLDDTRRPEIRALAEELGCEYLTRSDNQHAKAGNLNHAIARTRAEFIAVFDADFVPTKNFLTRTIGFFQEPKVALVQTPQSFYNTDPIARNLGLENVLTPEEEVFYRQIQPMRDGAGSVICSGTSFVVRRQALEDMGGFVTDSLSEDYFTGIRLAARGHQLVYLNEKLSAGLAAENITTHAMQRLRWARGTLQAFFIEANPLTIPGLSPLQRLGHLEGLLNWFTSLPRILFLLMPLAYSFLGVIPLQANAREILYFFVPYYFVQIAVFGWLNERSRAALLSDIYALVLVFPLAITVIQVMLRPFAKGFNVTPKGTSSDRFSVNWGLAWPLMLVFGLSAVSLWRNLGMYIVKSNWASQASSPTVAEQLKGLELGWIWSGFNLLVLGIALLILIDVPRPDAHAWFDLRRVVRLTFYPHTPQASTWWGTTTFISEVGLEVAVTEGGLPSLSAGETLPVALEISEIGLQLQGQVTHIGSYGEFPALRVAFEPMTAAQHRQLVEMLFCRPGQWKDHHSPGELRSLAILFQILLRPRVLFDRKVEVRPVVVAKT